MVSSWKFILVVPTKVKHEFKKWMIFMKHTKLLLYIY